MPNNNNALVIGFYILTDGDFLFVYDNKKIKLQNAIVQWIDVPDAPDNSNCFGMKTPVGEQTHLVELSDRRIILIYLYGTYYNSACRMTLIDLKNLKCVTSKIIPFFYSYSVLSPSLLLCRRDDKVAKIISYENDELTLKNTVQLRGHILPDNKGYISLSNYPAKAVLKNETSEIKELKLTASASPAWQVASWTFPIPSYTSSTKYFTPLSNDYFACISLCDDNFLMRHTSTIRLHIIKNDLTHSYKTKINTACPDMMIANNQYIFMVDKNLHKILIYNFEGKKLNEDYIDQNLYTNYFRVNSVGQFVSCSLRGKLYIQQSYPSKKLYQEMTDILLYKNIKNKMLLPSVLISLVSEYLGFFKMNSQKRDLLSSPKKISRC